MNCIVLRAARDDLEEAIRHYEEDRPGRGSRFSRAFEKAMKGVQLFPFAASIVDTGVRCCKIKRFPYGIVYRVDDRDVVVFAVIHLHRGPGTWERRLNK